MTTVARLTIEMAANVARIKQDMAKASSTVDGAMSKIQKSAQVATRALGAIGVALSAGQLVGMVRDLGRVGTEIQNLSRLAGTSTKSFQEMAFGAQKFGIQQDKLADILKDTQDKVGDFLATGAGGMADFFENIAPRVGVTAENFRQLNGRDALQLYISSLEKANISQAEMTFYMEAIASDSSALIPLFAQNGKALNDFAQQAQSLGIVLSEETIVQAQKFDAAMQTLEAGLSGIARSAAAEMLPALNQLAEGFLKSFAEGDRLRGLTTVLAGAMKVAVSAIILVVDALRIFGNNVSGIFAAISKAIDGDFKGAFETLKETGSGSLEILKQSIDSVTTVWDENTGATIQAAAVYQAASTSIVKNAKDREKADKSAEKAASELNAAKEKALALTQKAVDAQLALTDGYESELESLREQIAAVGASNEQLMRNANAKTDATIASLEYLAALEAENGGNRTLFNEYKRQIEVLKQVKQARVDLYDKGAAQELAEKNKEIAKALEDDLVDAFESAFLQGGSFADSFRRALEAQFSKMVLRPIVQGVLGSAGFGGAGGGAGGLGNLGMFGGLAAQSAALGQTLGTAALSFSQFIGATNSATASLVGAGVKIGQAAPYLGAALAVDQILFGGKVTGSITNALGITKRPKSYHGNYSTAGGFETMGATGQTRALDQQGKAIADSVAAGYARLAENLEVTAQDLNVMIQNSIIRQGERFDTSLNAMIGNINLLEDTRFKTGDEQEMAAWVAARTDRLILAALQVSANTGDVAQNIRGYLVRLGDVSGMSDEAVQNALLLAQALDAVNDRFDSLAGISAEALTELLNFTGGLDGLQGALGAFYTAFTSQEQQRLDLIENTAQALLRAGVAQADLNALVDENGQFVANARDLVREYTMALDANDPAQRAQLQAILALTPAMDSLLPSLEDAEEAVKKLTEAERERATLTEQIARLEAELNGTVREYELSLVDESNRALQERIFALQDEIDAQQQAAQAAEQAAQALERIQGLGRNIADYVRGLGIAEATLTPQQRLQGAGSEFNRLLGLARGGDESALSQITGASDAFLNAARDFYGASEPFQNILSGVKSSLLDLPAVQSIDERILGGITELVEVTRQSSAEIITVAQQIVAGLDQRGALVNSIFDGFSKLDLTADGLLTIDELKQSGLASDASLQSIFAEIDSNGDGVISRLEISNARLSVLEQAVRQSVGSLFDQIDSGGGGINIEEFRTAFGSLGLGERLDSIFSELDINGNGTISRLEAGNLTSDQILQRLAVDSILSYGRSEVAAAYFYGGKYLSHWLGDIAFYTRIIMETMSQAGPGVKVYSMNREGTAAFFADGGAFTGGVVRRPTFFNKDVMGEAGPEAILPLSNVGGQLGVRAQAQDMSPLVNEVRALRQDVRETGNLMVKVVTPDGRVISEQTINQIRERSRRGELVVYADGVKS